MKPEDDPPWVAEVAAEIPGWPALTTCEVCDRSPAYEVAVGERRWTLCSNPGCRALVEPVRTFGELAEIRKAGL